MLGKGWSLLAVAVSLVSVTALPKVTRSGRYLYNEDGTRFYIKGVAYQEQGAVVPGNGNDFLEPSTFFDPLADAKACTRDVSHLKDLGVNAIRVYSVNSSLNHDSCMKTFSEAGIYTIIDLALPLNGSIDRTVPSWSTNILNQYLATIDVFSKYDNVLAYNVGNEVVTGTVTPVSPYVKAAARDIRAYLKSKKLTTLIGYAAINGRSDFRLPLANYLTCDPSSGNSDATSIDLYGLNNYAWCGADTIAAYSDINTDFANYNVAAYFSEFGCVRETRLWTEVAALFGTEMSTIWSGGIAFSYFPASSADGAFGMVTISGDTVTTSADFTKLKDEYAKITSFVNTPSAGSSQASYPSCPSNTDAFTASTSLPPTPNAAACSCLESNLSCRFTPQTSNYSVIVGDLLNQGCSFVGQKGGNCDDIAGGTTGTYGRLSGCDPTIKLSFIMSKNFELNNRDAQACNFGGNGTVNPLAPSTAAAADAAASSCVSNPGATFAPSGVSPGGPAPTSSGSSTNKPTNNNNGAVGLAGDTSALIGLMIISLFSLLSGIWTMT